MAFPVPAHLPRKKDVHDVSTEILTKISETNSKSLNARLSSTWVAELDDTIRLTKETIHERIGGDLPSFERQLSASKSIQERLHTLTENVDQLSDSLSSPESGLIPKLVSTLTQHAALAREVADADVRYSAVAHLERCRNQVRSSKSLVQDGRLPEAVEACESLDKFIATSPAPLEQSRVILDLKRDYAAMRNRTEEQLLDAYARSIMITPSELVVRPSIQVRQSSTILPFSSILSSLSRSSLTTHLSTLRRDVIANCIDFVLEQPISMSVSVTKDTSGAPEHRLSMFPAPPNSEVLVSRLENLSSVLTFLNDHLFPHLPPQEHTTFPLSLCKPLRTALLNSLLIPSLPSSLPMLPDFLDLAERAVAFEDQYIVSMLGDNGVERDIKTWVGGIGMHYERKRRVEILQVARVVVIRPEDESQTFHVDLDIVLEHEDKVAEPAAEAKPVVVEKESESAWGFEDESPIQGADAATGEESGWDFEDEVAPEPELGPAQAEQRSRGDAIEEDPGDAWGWNDDEASPTVADESLDDSAWDDAWDEKPSQVKSVASSPELSPKTATRLEKFSSKGKPPQSTEKQKPASVKLSPLVVQPSPVVRSNQAKPTVVTESYVVSGRTKQLLQLLEDVLKEGAELASSGILSSAPVTPTGSVIMQSAPMTLELFRALYPVTNHTELVNSPKRAMRLSNDCLFISGEVKRILTNLRGPKLLAKQKLEDCVERMKVLADSLYEDTIHRENQLIEELLDSTQGFVDTTDQERFDDCENAVNQVLQRVRRIAQQWKAVLNKSRYYDAIGCIVDAALARILGDILALQDITEVESHRLSELCRILNALEGLFVEDPEQPSFVVSYVPSWLKYSYLSELLEASIADISYLFDEGALVDFDIEELVKLVRALFADTPLRTNTINKLLRRNHST